MVLDSTLKKIEVDLTGAVSANQLEWVVDYVEFDSTTFLYTAIGSVDGLTNNTTAVTMLAAPAAGKIRQAKQITVYNADTVAAEVSVQLNDNAAIRRRYKDTVQPGKTLTYAF